VVALLAGTWLTQVLGPRAVFPVLAVLSLAALPLAWSLPRDGAVDRAPRAASVLGRPGPLDGLFFVHGFGVDGVFAVSITLLIAERSGAGAAILSGGALLAARHVIDAVAGPVFGALGDRHGATLMLSITVVLSAMGFAGVAFGATVVGALVMLVFRGAAAALGPSAVVQAAGEDDPVMGALARMQAWRDLGAAVGPLVTGLALVSIPATVLHAGVAALLVLVLGWWRVSRRA
jgi:predicted MFS family arabinose efflux permease